MLTKDQIKKKLKENPNWEPEGDLTAEEWQLFDEVFDELESSGELSFEDEDEDMPKKGDTKDEDGDDDDYNWDEEDDGWE